MATIKLYKSTNSSYYLEVTYSVSPGKFTLEKIVGYTSGIIYYGGGKDSKTHYIRLPDGNVFGFQTAKGTDAYYNGQYYGTGYGVSPSGMTWQLIPITFSCKEGSTGLISIQNYLSSIDYNYEGNFDASSNITIPVSITNPTIKTIQATSTYNSITASASIDNTGGANITSFSLTCNGKSFSNTDGSGISGTFTELTPNTEYEIEAMAKNSSGLSGATKTSITTSNIQPLKLKNFTINTSSNNELVLNYTLPDFFPTVNKLFGQIQINSQQIRGFESTKPEVEWRESSPGAEDNPCFVFYINNEKTITLTGLKNKNGEVIELKEGDNIQVWLLTGVDYENKEYFVNENWITVSKIYQAAPWIFISPFGKKAEGLADYEEVEMIIMNSGYKTKIQSSKSEKEVT